MKQYVRIEGSHIDLDALKQANHTPESLKKTEIFNHLPDAKQGAAYAALQSELDAYEAKPVSVTVEKGASVKNVTPEVESAPQSNDDTSKAKSKSSKEDK